ncbi:hypothetical protein KI387_033041, partial [Taxus chinensis]
IHSGLRGEGPEGEEGTEVEEGVATVEMEKCVKTLGGDIEKKPTLQCSQG